MGCCDTSKMVFAVWPNGKITTTITQSWVHAGIVADEKFTQGAMDVLMASVYDDTVDISSRETLWATAQVVTQEYIERCQEWALASGMEF